MFFLFFYGIVPKGREDRNSLLKRDYNNNDCGTVRKFIFLHQL